MVVKCVHVECSGLVGMHKVGVMKFIVKVNGVKCCGCWVLKIIIVWACWSYCPDIFKVIQVSNADLGYKAADGGGIRALC